MTLDQALRALGMMTDAVTHLTAENEELRAALADAPPVVTLPILADE